MKAQKRGSMLFSFSYWNPPVCSLGFKDSENHSSFYLVDVFVHSLIWVDVHYNNNLQKALLYKKRRDSFTFVTRTRGQFQGFCAPYTTSAITNVP